MIKLIIYTVYLTMVKLAILKLVMVQLPMKKLVRIKSNHGQFNNSWFRLSQFSHDN
jgi:hypothetical protein